MARMVSGRPRRREGRGLGEMLSEGFIFILIAVGLVGAGVWYFTVYLKSPQVSLQGYLTAVNSGNTEAQWSHLTERTQKYFGDRETYADKYAMAHGLAARLATFTIGNSTSNGDTWEADATLNVRKTTSSLLSTETESFTNHYVLAKESGGWKIDLLNAKSKVDLSKAGSR